MTAPQRRPWWTYFVTYAVFYALIWVANEALKAVFPDVMETVYQVVAVPALVFVVAFFAYRVWHDVAQPPRRR